MAKGIQEAVEAAIKFEQDGQAYYRDAAAKSTNRIVKDMFEALARDEDKHETWLREMASVSLDLASHSKDLYDKLKGIYADAPAESTDSLDDDIEAAKMAVDMEENSVKVYTDWAASSDTEELKELGNTLAGFEKYHVQLLQNAIFYLQQPSEWFTEEERWIFDGGTSST